MHQCAPAGRPLSSARRIVRMNRFSVLSAVVACSLAGLLPGSTKSAPPAAPATAAARVDPTSAGPATPAQLASGARVYRTLCLACHLPDGRGVPSVSPPLAAADYMLADRERAIRVVLRGLAGPITVSGESYNGVMPPLDAVLSDRQVADVLTYAFNTWGNTGDAFAADFVAGVRARSR
jgi:mono/diheme cytochrome c family protein